MTELVRRWIEVLGGPDRRAGGEPVLVDAEGAFDAAAIAGRIDATAARLEADTAPGDRVLLDAPRGVDWLAGFVACLVTGRVAVPLPEGAPAAEIAAIRERSSARVALVEGRGAAALPGDVRALAIDPGSSLAEDVARSLTRRDAPAGRDPALFLFTSGTTGRPKAAVITHDNLAAQVRALRAAWAMVPGDVLLHALPLHHTHGVVVALMTTLLAGGRARVLRRFDARVVWDSLGDATVWMAVPTMTAKLFEVFDAADEPTRDRWAAAARRLRLATSGSAALPVGLAERWRAITGAIPLERYGMTEIGMALSNPLDAARRRAGHVGAPLPEVEVRIVDETGSDAGDGPGELWVRGPSVFAGYFGDPAATAATFADGWFRTGDVAIRDRGSFRLLGRASVDILKTGGEKVSALEIEEVLREHPAISEVAVVGIPDPTWGDRVVAAVVPATGRVADCTPPAVRAWAKERLAPFKVPRDVVVVDALPRNAMGKVQKPALADLLKGEPPGR